MPVVKVTEVPQAQAEMYRIGYALPPKKLQNFLGTSLDDYAKQQGIDLVPIDLTKPLAQHGPFHCIIHKLQPQDWATLDLDQYQAQNPNVIIVDPPHMVERIRNRSSMLGAVTDLQLPLHKAVVAVPSQVVVNTEDEMKRLNNLPLQFPLLAKPLFADGSVHSHELRLVFNREGLATLETPVVLQEFVNHGGVVFKVYVAGEHVICVKRRSLHDLTEEKVKTLKGTLPISQISSLSEQEERDNGDGGDAVSDIEKAEIPAEDFITELAKALREKMGLNLFNVDMIRDAKDCNRYLVIDINYFPAYSKLPCFEAFITSFLLDCVKNKTDNGRV